MKKNVLVIVLVLVLAGLAVYQNQESKSKAASLPTDTAPKPNFLAPSFSLPSLSGETFQAGGKSEKPIFLNFWASWCGPCRSEAPDLKKMYDKYKDQVVFYGVNVTHGDRLEDAKAFVKEFGLEFPILTDTKGIVSEQYGIQVIPTSFLIDRNGVIADAINLAESDVLEKKIKALIKR